MTDEEKFKQWVALAEELGKSTVLPEWQRNITGQIGRIVREGLAAMEGVRASVQPGPTNTELPVEPRYEHDCISCVFLGTYRDDTEMQDFDLYFCQQQVHGNNRKGFPTVIARSGSDPWEYRSGMMLAMTDPVLKEARDRAIAKGLIR